MSALADIRIRRGLGPAQAAEQIGVSYRTLRRAERSPSGVSIASLHKIAMFYELDPVALSHGVIEREIAHHDHDTEAKAVV